VPELCFRHHDQFELMINLRTAKELALAIPSSVLASADDVIQ